MQQMQGKTCLATKHTYDHKPSMSRNVFGPEQRLNTKLVASSLIMVLTCEEPAPATRLSSVTCYLGRAGGWTGAQSCIEAELERRYNR
jgi:hypothetical protein